MGKTKRNARGGGSISKRKDGRWCGRYTVVLPNGQHKVRSVYGKTQSEAREKLAQCIARRDRGEITMGTGMTVEKFYEIWMSEVACNYLRPTTLELYKRIFQKYILPVLGKKKLASLDVDDVQKCLNSIKNHSVYQAQIAKKALSSMLIRARKRKLILTNPTRDVELQSIDNEAPVMWDEEQLKRFLEEAKVTSPYYVAYALIANYGLRRGEVLGLRWEDVDFVNKSIHIRQQVVSVNNHPRIGKPKTKKSKRELALNEWLFGLLEERFVPETKGLIFHTKNNTPIAPRNFYRDFQKVSKRARLPHIKIHALRHMAACFMRDAGVDLKTCQDILGHSTSFMTLDVYQHSDINHKRDASNKIGSLLLA